VPVLSCWVITGRCFGVLVAALLLCACSAWPRAHSAAMDCGGVSPIPWQLVAPSVWVWLPGREAEVDARNAGHVVPTSVLVDGGEAVVIDPGPSHRHAQRVALSVQCHFGARVRWIVNTHAHAENVLGNSAFADAQAQGYLRIAASGPTLDAMRLRCPECLDSLTQRAGAQAMVGTRVVWPDTRLQAGDTLRVGMRELRVLEVVAAHTEGDLLLWDAQTGVLWAGGLVYGQRLPELAQGRLDHWLSALDRLAALRPRVVVGSTVSVAEGAVEVPPALKTTRAYLTDLRRAVLTAMDAGRAAHESSQLALPAYAGWAGYTERQGFNAQRAWRELEPVWMDRMDPPAPPAASPLRGGTSGPAKPVPPHPGARPSAPQTH